MEIRKDLVGIDKYKPSFEDGIEEYFEKALSFTRTFYPGEIERISSVKFEELSPDEFYKEFIWVVHATGFSAKAVGKFIPRLLDAYGNWHTLGEEDFGVAFERIKKVCNNPQKSKAVHKIATTLCKEIPEYGWEKFRSKKLSNPFLLEKLPFIGKVTCFHLGRNIGLLDCVKPDLHLERMALHWGFEDCYSMCEKVQKDGMPLGVIDFILWLMASTFGTMEIKKENQR